MAKVDVITTANDVSTTRIVSACMSLLNLLFSVVQLQNKRARIWAGVPYTK